MLKSVLCYYSDVYKLVKAFKKVVWYGADAAAIAADKSKKKSNTQKQCAAYQLYKGNK